MRDHQHDGAGRPQLAHHVRERRLAEVIEVGVGFVEQHQKGPAKDRARQPDPLRQPARERHAARADDGVIAFGQGQDGLVHIGHLGRGNHRPGVGLGREAGDVLGNRAVKQLDVLRQVADKLPAPVGVPLVQGGMVIAHTAGHHRGQPRERLEQGGLARPGRADHAQTLTGAERAVDMMHQRGMGADLGAGQILQRERGRRQRQFGPRPLARRQRQRLAEAVIAPARRQKDPPLGHGHLQRRKTAPGNDRGRNDNPRRDLLTDRQPRPQPQHAGLHHQPQGLDGLAVEPVDVGHPHLLLEAAAVMPRPVPVQRRLHAHGQDHLRLLAAFLDHIGAVQPARLPQAVDPLAVQLIDQHQRQDQHAAGQREGAEIRVKHKHHADVYRHPGDIKDGARAGAGQELADGAQVIDRPVAGPLGALQGRQLVGTAVGARGELRLHMAADALQDAGAEDLQQPVKTI